MPIYATGPRREYEGYIYFWSREQDGYRGIVRDARDEISLFRSELQKTAGMACMYARGWISERTATLSR